MHFFNKITFGMLKPLDTTKQEIGVACCFKDFVSQFKRALVPSKPPAALSYVLRGVGKVASLPVSAITGVYNMFSDARLKNLWKVVFALDVQGKTLKFYLYQLRPEAVGVIPNADTETWHIGLVAQEVQQAFPDAVYEKNGYLSIHLNKLPCNAHAILAALNGLPTPKCPRTKGVVVHGRSYPALRDKTRRR